MTFVFDLTTAACSPTTPPTIAICGRMLEIRADRLRAESIRNVTLVKSDDALSHVPNRVPRLHLLQNRYLLLITELTLLHFRSAFLKAELHSCHVHFSGSGQ